MNYSIDDLLLGYLQYLATFDVAKKRLYLWKKIYLKNRKTIGKCLSMTTQKINRHIDKLKENGLLSEDSENFYFPYNEAGKYKLVNYEMLSYLVNTRNSNAIKIYCLLSYMCNETEFQPLTEDWICEQIGLNGNSERNQSTVRTLIKTLEKCKFIETRKQNIFKWDDKRKREVPQITKFYRLCSLDEWKKLDKKVD